jgi:hypothetical protein
VGFWRQKAKSTSTNLTTTRFRMLCLRMPSCRKLVNNWYYSVILARYLFRANKEKR